MLGGRERTIKEGTWTMVEQLDEAKARSQRVWAAGNFARIGAFTTTPAERLVEEVGLRASQTVLDIACGNGAVTLAAARRQAKVVGVDFVPELLEHGRKRAELDGLEAGFVEGDAEDLRFPDASFDVVLSQYGVMFAANQERAAAEMLRVCRPGGVIGLANWTPLSFPSVLFRLGAEFNPPAVPPKHPSNTTGRRPAGGGRSAHPTSPLLARRAPPQEGGSGVRTNVIIQRDEAQNRPNRQLARSHATARSYRDPRARRG